MNCFKCFRKSLLDAALEGVDYPGPAFEKVIRFRGGEKIVLGTPIKHENVFRWTVENLRISGVAPTWSAFVDRLRTGAHEVSWARAWYSRAADLIPEAFRENAIREIIAAVGEHTDEQRRAFEEWDLRSDLESESMQASIARLSKKLKDYDQSHPPVEARP